MFESESTALAVLGGIKGDQIAQGVTPQEIPGFKNASGVLEEVRNEEESATLFFVEKRALVKVAVSGPNSQALLLRFAETARVKAGRQ